VSPVHVEPVRIQLPPTKVKPFGITRAQSEELRDVKDTKSHDDEDGGKGGGGDEKATGGGGYGEGGGGRGGKGEGGGGDAESS